MPPHEPLRSFAEIPHDTIECQIVMRLDVSAFARLLMTSKRFLLTFIPNTFSMSGQKVCLSKIYWHTLCIFQISARCAYTHAVNSSKYHSIVEFERRQSGVRPLLTYYDIVEGWNGMDFDTIAEHSITPTVRDYLVGVDVFSPTRRSFSSATRISPPKELQILISANEQNPSLVDQMKDQFANEVFFVNRLLDDPWEVSNMKRCFGEQLKLGNFILSGFRNKIVQPGLSAMRTWREKAALVLEGGMGYQAIPGGAHVLYPRLCSLCGLSTVEGHTSAMICTLCEGPTTMLENPQVVRLYVQVCMHSH